MARVQDRLGRRLGTLRISVTDRCNLRCEYCMPEREYVWLPKPQILSFEELTRLSRVFVGLGVDKIRLTGGEPLLRAELPELVRRLKGIAGLRELALTTNGILLAEQASALRAAGLDRVTVSLDTLDSGRFLAIARRPSLEAVLEGLRAAREAGFPGLKLDTVLMRGQNDDEILPLLDFARSIGAELRFIEYMDVGGATAWRPEAVVTRKQILAEISGRHGAVERLPNEDGAPADRYRLLDGTIFGVISSVTEPFCQSCDRARVTADGTFYTCLYASEGLDLRAGLRGGADDLALTELLRARWTARADRGAEIRAALPDRAPLVEIGKLRLDPRLEMHARGG